MEALKKPAVYVAAPFIHKEDAAAAAALFEEAGFTITRDWWKYDSEENPDIDKAQCAYEDVVGVVDADFVVLLNSAKSEGKAVETGIALTLMKYIVVIGEKSNIFHHLECMNFAPDVPSAIKQCQEVWTQALAMQQAQPLMDPTVS